jgi:hypothetical protein
MIVCLYKTNVIISMMVVVRTNETVFKEMGGCGLKWVMGVSKTGSCGPKLVVYGQLGSQWVVEWWGRV